MQDFVHLHVHTQYSLLDGQGSVAKLVDKAIADGMRGMAVTDHGNMFAMKEFVKYVDGKNRDSDRPFKPIIGSEMYVARRGMAVRKDKMDQRGYHLIVLAKNEKGYHNLLKLMSRSWTEGFYMTPRTERSELEKYHEGLIISSACLGGEVPQHILHNRFEEAEATIKWFKDLFGDDYYLELQRHKATVPQANHETYPKQQIVNQKLMEYAKKYDIKLICTNDVHFVNEEDAEAHDRLICLSTSRTIDDPNRMLYSKQEWLKTQAEMNTLFADVPEALANTIEILDKVETYSIDHAPIMPNFPIPKEFGTEEEYRKNITTEQLFDEFTQDENGQVVMTREEGEKKIKKLGGYDSLYRIKFEADYLKELTYKGARERYGQELSKEVTDRINFELHVMKTMGFPGYFLIVQDFINVARNELGVLVGPGRGSAAGSVVAYCLGITKIDPLKYDLLFERFLNPDRISLPDIDTDFDDDGRYDVLEWVVQKYGKEKVAHIITYSTMASKMAIKDVARVEDLPLAESNRLCKYIPARKPENWPEKKLTLQACINNIPELKEAENSSNPLLHDTIKYAKMLEGSIRGTGIHACGIIISRDDITDWVPVSTAEDKESGEEGRLVCTQYEGSVIEETGLIKMDFLGLKTLSILREALINVKKRHGIDIDLDNLPLDDAETYRLFCEGRTVGTFQFESAGMQKYLRELQPSSLEDLIAMNALYRPGPMDNIPDFIDRKHGKKPIEYDIPCMEKYLKETYGITVYQEQVMQLSRLLANFTRGESDTLRKAMGKKQKDKLDHLKPKFIAGGKANGHDPQVLEKIWSEWEKFASYAFNKSHATGYAWVAYQTAYLKAHYPAEFMAANLSRNFSDIEQVTKFMNECQAMGIKVLGPDVNESDAKFTVNKAGDIRFGLTGIKGVGKSAVEDLVAEREANGPFADVFDFFKRVNLKSCNSKTLESLAYAGAFDCFPDVRREQFFEETGKNERFLDALINYGNKCKADSAFSGGGLFGDDMVEISTPKIPPFREWSVLQKLNMEKELVGMYLSAHPLDEYGIFLKGFCNSNITEIKDLELLASRGSEVTLGGMVTKVYRGTDKRNNSYGRITLEDYAGSGEFFLFGSDWANFHHLLEENMLVFIRARVQPRQWNKEQLELKVTSVELLSDAKDKLIEKMTIFVPLWRLDDELVADMAALAKGSRGKTELDFVITDEDNEQNIRLVAPGTGLQIGQKVSRFMQTHPELSFALNQA